MPTLRSAVPRRVAGEAAGVAPGAGRRGRRRAAGQPSADAVTVGWWGSPGGAVAGCASPGTGSRRSNVPSVWSSAIAFQDLGLRIDVVVRRGRDVRTALRNTF